MPHLTGRQRRRFLKSPHHLLSWRARGNGRPLPRVLVRLLAAQGLYAHRADEVDGVRVTHGVRGTWYLACRDGVELKGRVHRPEVVRRMRAMAVSLPQPGFTRLLAAWDTAVLEPWVAGTAAEPASVDDAREAGRLLRRLHEALLPIEAPGPESLLEAWHSKALKNLQDLASSGRLGTPLALDLSQRLDAGRPVCAVRGLAHGDFRPANLVRGPDRLWCVDNVTVRPGLLEVDLARMLALEGLPSECCKAFVDGYGEAPALVTVQATLAWWALTLRIESAAWRCRAGAPGVEAACAGLATYAS